MQCPVCAETPLVMTSRQDIEIAGVIGKVVQSANFTRRT